MNRHRITVDGVDHVSLEGTALLLGVEADMWDCLDYLTDPTRRNGDPMSDRKPLSGLVWEEPPTPRAGRGGTGPRHTAVADALKAKPGEWARIAQYDRPRGAFEATSRTIRSGHIGSQVVYVYARYVGVPDTP